MSCRLQAQAWLPRYEVPVSAGGAERSTALRYIPGTRWYTGSGTVWKTKRVRGADDANTQMQTQTQLSQSKKQLAMR